VDFQSTTPSSPAITSRTSADDQLNQRAVFSSRWTEKVERLIANKDLYRQQVIDDIAAEVHIVVIGLSGAAGILGASK
jgi:hypothetical protein